MHPCARLRLSFLFHLPAWKPTHRPRVRADRMSWGVPLASVSFLGLGAHPGAVTCEWILVVGSPFKTVLGACWLKDTKGQPEKGMDCTGRLLGSAGGNGGNPGIVTAASAPRFFAPAHGPSTGIGSSGSPPVSAHDINPGSLLIAERNYKVALLLVLAGLFWWCLVSSRLVPVSLANFHRHLSASVFTKIVGYGSSAHRAVPLFPAPRSPSLLGSVAEDYARSVSTVGGNGTTGSTGSSIAVSGTRFSARIRDLNKDNGAANKGRAQWISNVERETLFGMLQIL
ncbi:hypothetical protein C8F04DRAFT_1315285 [Mycena alexandri]|uniref:Uncharacterized protein n=1 Tax=Mycena alexandri TaxID=1745969 RepID=A0AAD6T723_9AGAR|nr:hypothetical protein C8F04DRAFT_1315285 [Mycena alexandri]